MRKVFTGYNGDIAITDTGVTIRRGWKGAVVQQKLRGSKSVPWGAIGSVNFKRAGVTPGYIRLSYVGGWETHEGATPAILDENAITWLNPRKNKEAERIRDIILERLSSARG